MRLLELTTRGFRNLSLAVVSFGPGWNLVVGENGQGKTNLLEAVALLCGQRSFRRASPADLSAGGESFAIEGKLRRGFATEDLSVEWSSVAGRRFRRSGKEISFREASALAPAVFLALEHRALVTGPPEARRRFLDRLVLGYRPLAGADLAAYDRARLSFGARRLDRGARSGGRGGPPASPGGDRRVFDGLFGARESGWKGICRSLHKLFTWRKFGSAGDPGKDASDRAFERPNLGRAAPG